MMAKSPSVLLTTFAILVLLFLNAPTLVIALASFNSTALLTIPPQGWTLDWFAAVLNDTGYLRAIGTSLLLASLATAVSLVLGVAASYALHHKMVPGKDAIVSLMMAPLVFPAVVIGVALLQYVSMIGLRGSFAVLVLAHAIITLPYVVRSALASLSGLNHQIEEAARVLGSSGFTAFRLVTLPILKPGLVAGGIFSFVTSLDNVPVTIFLISPRQTTLPVKIFAAVEQGVDPSIAAASTLMIVGTALILMLAQRWVNFTRFF